MLTITPAFVMSSVGLFACSLYSAKGEDRAFSNMAVSDHCRMHGAPAAVQPSRLQPTAKQGRRMFRDSSANEQTLLTQQVEQPRYGVIESGGVIQQVQVLVR